MNAPLSALWIQEFTLLPLDAPENLDVPHHREAFQETFRRAWRGEIENDSLNRLVLRAQLDWRQITVLRAYCKYLLQAGGKFSRAYMEQALDNNPGIARDLFELFAARCNPDTGEQERMRRSTVLGERIENALEQVASLDEDRILRRFLGVIRATLRTNYFQTTAEGTPKAYLSFKLNPAQVPGLPEPRPRFEIFVYSPRVEGVHLRGGHVARGGLRWSDRPEDFRTEVLGLVKAQMVKNAVIVPVGSKGGFVLKRPPAGREQLLIEGVACYQTFIRGLLDLTDNLVDGEIVPPPRVVRYDGDDPYLVVAADKGTASFSDLANAVSAEYGFWLGDAFASGGSAGYDHKKMGITARGAWECVKRHFRELGRDIQSENFTVAGIGDMSGDVFGNGLLLSSCTKLVGAFNHLHIFLDPDPDPQTGFAERKRLFELPRSTWMDYDSALISKGGGVYSRQAKSIPLSPEVRKLLDLDKPQATPNEVIRALLRAEVDLLWNGGIGTYVKAHTEHHGEVGDRTNDALRVDGRDLRCKVAGEGGNLGFTQAGRIEYARKGGRINSDALDNSGGVDCSDYEVNIKILLDAVVAAQDLTLKQRNALLEDMTEAVAEAVLRDNYLQSQAVSLSATLAPRLLDLHARFILALEQSGRLERDLEFLPSVKELAARRKTGEGLTRPELCVLLAYAKIDLYPRILASEIPDSEWLQPVLAEYFPSQLRERFPQAIAQHRLRREIVATQFTNRVINYCGCEFIYAVTEDTGYSAADCVRAFAAAWEVFAMDDLWSRIQALDNHVDNAVQQKLLLDMRKHTERTVRWLLRNHPELDMADTIRELRPGVQSLITQLPELLCPTDAESIAQKAADLEQSGVPAALARHVAGFNTWLAVLDILAVAHATDVAQDYVAALHFMLGTRLKLHWLRDRIALLPRDDRWQTMARSAQRDELYRVHRELTAVVLRSLDSGILPRPGEHLETWVEPKQSRIERCLKLLEDIAAQSKPDLAMLSVGLREVRGLV